eukprot:3397152-Pleurochrysis_carterae.AAC.2
MTRKAQESATNYSCAFSAWCCAWSTPTELPAVKVEDGPRHAQHSHYAEKPRYRNATHAPAYSACNAGRYGFCCTNVPVDALAPENIAGVARARAAPGRAGETTMPQRNAGAGTGARARDAGRPGE